MIYKTTDGGNFWVGQIGASQYLSSVKFKDMNEGWAVGVDGEMVHTTDGGTTWYLDTTGIGGYMGNFNDVTFTPGGKAWAVGDYGKIVATYAGGPQPSVTVSLPDTIVAPGDTFSYNIYISDVALEDSIFSYDFKLYFDTAFVEYLGLDITGTLSDGFSIDSNLIYQDTLLVSAASATAITYSGTLLMLKFAVNVNAQAMDTVYISFEDFAFNENIPGVVFDYGSIIIAGPLYGDVSADGSISSFDASLILQYRVDKITLSDTALTAADVSANGTVSAFDAALILQYVAGYITEFQAGFMFAPKEAYKNFIALLNKGFEDNELVEYSVYIKDVKDIYSSEISLRFSGLELIGCERPNDTEDFLMESNVKDKVLKVALAGYKSVSGNVEVVKIKFRKVSNDVNISLDKVIVNEVEIKVSDGSGVSVPDRYELNQNYPNPFNSETVIRYQLPEGNRVEISVYNILGQRVRILVDKEMNAGYYNVKWDGRNDSGSVVASGIYIVKMKAGNFFKVRKLIYLR